MWRQYPAEMRERMEDMGRIIDDVERGVSGGDKSYVERFQSRVRIDVEGVN